MLLLLSITSLFISQQDPGAARECLLALHAHQDKWEKERQIPMAFVTDDKQVSEKIAEVFKEEGMRSDVAIIRVPAQEGVVHPQISIPLFLSTCNISVPYPVSAKLCLLM